MRNIFYIVFIAYTGLLISCSGNDNLDLEDSNNNPIYYAETDTVHQTRTFLSPERFILWSPKDQIAIFPKGSVPDLYELVSGEGTRSGSFKFVRQGSYTSGSEFMHNIAVYPYRSDYIMSKNEDGNYYIDNILIPSNQNYVENSYSLNAMPMVAIANGNNLKFKNIGGLLKLQLKSEYDVVKIKKITIESRTNNQKIAGHCGITVFHDGKNPIVSIKDNSSEIVTLNCPMTEINSNKNTIFFISLPCIDFSRGFIINIYDELDNKMVLNSKKCTINRNEILTMPEVIFKPTNVQETEWVDLGLSVKWASKNVGASATEYSGPIIQWNSAINKKGRIPSSEECKELIDNCTWIETTFKGHDGIIAKSKINGNSIFFPNKPDQNDYSLYYVGGYWTSTYYIDMVVAETYAELFYPYSHSLSGRYGVQVAPGCDGVASLVRLVTD